MEKYGQSKEPDIVEEQPVKEITLKMPRVNEGQAELEDSVASH